MSVGGSARYDPSVSYRETIQTTCRQCGVTFLQVDDPGRKREFCSNACRQRAYRARGGRASGTRRETPGARRRREEREAWAKQKAQQEARNERRRTSPPPPADERPRTPGWVFSADTDPYKRAKRRVCRLLWERASHRSTPEAEATACRERAEEMRVRYGL